MSVDDDDDDDDDNDDDDELLPSFHQHRVSIIAVKHVHTKPCIFV